MTQGMNGCDEMQAVDVRYIVRPELTVECANTAAISLREESRFDHTELVDELYMVKIL